MSSKNTVFYRQNKQVLVDFSSEKISSDGALILLEKLERKHKIIKEFSKTIPEWRNQNTITHDIYKLLLQRVTMMIQGYEDNNDVAQLKHDPLFQDFLQGDLASQPTMSRFENSISKHTIFGLLNTWVDKYIDSLKGRNQIVIDIDATDAETYGNQQLSMFNGFYGHFMLNELFFHDGETGQIICPVLRPGNSHSNKWYVAILKRIVAKIKMKYPDLKIIVRADAGFSCPEFYSLAKTNDIKLTVGIASNPVLKRKSARVERAVRIVYANQGIKNQHFISFPYKADSWEEELTCVCKVESTGKGMNIRYVMTNFEDQSPRDIYSNFYVLRGEASENRIKEVKNMCFSDRMSNHKFFPNFFRLFISCLAYEFILIIKNEIKKTKYEVAKKWQISTIRTLLLKVGATIKITKRKIIYKLSKAFVYKDLFLDLIRLE